MSALTLYTTTWCPFCARLTAGLHRLGIEWDEVDVDADEAAADLVRSLNGGNRVVPTVVFADGTSMTNPPAADVAEKLADL